MTNWIWNPFTGNLDGCGGDGALEFVLKQKRLIWDTAVDWNRGDLGTDVEVVGTGTAAAIAPKTTLWPGTEVYLTWHLNETEGTTAADSSYYNQPGTLMTVSEFLNPSLWVAGKLNNAISNPGEYEAVNYIDGGDIAAFEWNDPFSVECWFNHTPGYDVSLAGNYDSADEKGWQVYIQEDYLRFDLHGGPGLYLQVYTTAKVTTSIYQHLVITYDGSGLAAGVKFYLDGTLMENSVYYDGLTESSIVPAANDFRVMANMRTGWGWIGQIDEFILYTVVLSQANVDFRYNAGAGTQTPVFTQPIYPTTAHYETDIFDSKIAGQYWGSFNFTRTTPGGTTAVVKCRVSDDENNMGSFGSALVPGATIGLNGQFIQFSVDFTGTPTVRSMVDYISALYIAPDVEEDIDMTSFVPYLGATQNVDLGAFYLITTGTVAGSQLIATDHIDTPYINTQEIKTDLITPSDLTVITGANKTLVLSSVVWDDMRVTGGNIDRPGVSDPVWVLYNVNGGGINTYLLEFALNDYGTFVVQLPHAYKLGSDIQVHVHWTPGPNGVAENGNTVGWKIQYSWANIDGTFPTMLTADCSDACDGVNHKHQMSPEFVISGASKGISSMLLCNVTRTDTGADDTWVGTGSGALPLLMEIDFHFQMDTLGSRQDDVK